MQSLKNIVPWGRTLMEYKEMFMLTQNDLTKTILGCGDGPSSFNTELTKVGGKVVSIDPIYQFSKEQIELRVKEVKDEVMDYVCSNKNKFVWKSIENPDALEKIRMDAMQKFLDDFNSGGSSVGWYGITL